MQPKRETITIIDLMLAIRGRNRIYYHEDTDIFDCCPISEIERGNISPDALISDKDTNNFVLPSYEDIDHKEIMSFYVREFVEDKGQRKQLFDILRRRDYMNVFLDKLHELNLYDDFNDACGSVYIQIFDEWADKNGLHF